MIKKPVTIQNNMEIEDHPIAHLVQEASQYSSQIHIMIGGKKINAKSIMGLMTLKLQKGEDIVLVVEGTDEAEAAEGIESFLVTR
jgi:catabolite repression HPr-like protein